MLGWIRDKSAGLHWKLSTLIFAARAATLGVRLGRRCRFLGQPIVSGGEGGRIVLGMRVTAVSRSGGTALGVAKPVILRCLTPDATIVIGDDCGLSGTTICAAREVRIGRRCLFGADVTIFDTDFHPHAAEGRRYAKPDWASLSKPVIIGDDVFVGTRAVIAKGVTIGRGAIVAVGSIVTKDVPAMSVVGGNPATVLRMLDDAPEAASLDLAE